MGRILRNILLHVITAGMLVAAVTTRDPFWQQFELVLAAGAFALAWMIYD